MKVDFFTNIFSHYRLPIWRLLINSKNIDFNIFYSQTTIEKIKSIDESAFNNYEVKKLFPVLKNYTFLNKVFWQKGVIRRVLTSKSSGFIFLGEMTIISTWISVIICKIRKKKVFFWGHGVYGNENILKLFFRILFLKLPDVNLLYGNWSKNLLVKKGFDENKIQVIYNSIPSTSSKNKKTNLIYKKKHDWFQFQNNDILFAGRLNKKKGLDLLIEAHLRLLKEINDLRIIFIGEGPFKKELIKTNLSNLNKNIFFLDSIYDEEYLKYCFMNSKLLVSPGNVGLACIHSLSYGTPVCTHDEMKFQMPEAEALNSYNSFLFKRNDIESLKENIKNGINAKNNQKRIKIVEDVFKNYTPENQLRLIENKLLEIL